MHRPTGILLSRSPGTGKTLITRMICEMLHVQPKINHDLEIFSRFSREPDGTICTLFPDVINGSWQIEASFTLFLTSWILSANTEHVVINLHIVMYRTM